MDIVSLIKSKGFKELIKYGVVGGIGLIVDVGIFYLLTKYLAVQFPFSPFFSQLLGLPVDVINANVSHIISSVLAIINNFILNSYFTFKVTDHKLRRFASFFGIAAIGLAISTGLLTLFMSTFGLDEMIAKILATIIVAMLQFLFNKSFTFKK